VEKITSKDGTEISYWRSGTGKPLIIVHGAVSDHRSWARIAPNFEEHVTVYVMDRRGRGESGDTPEYHYLREAEDIAALAESVNEPACLFGHSFGGLLTLEAALLTDNISRLVLYEPVVDMEDQGVSSEQLERLQALVDRGELRAATEMFYKEMVELGEEELEAYRRSPLWEARILLARTIPRELGAEQTYRFDPQRFASLTTPTLLLLGSDSPRMYHRSAERVASALPNSQVVVLPGQQHLAHHSNPELLAREILRFMVG
jgi:pimeloyl-ACP methyl ester carboxylesterase